MFLWLICVMDMVVLTTFMAVLYNVWLIKMCKNSTKSLTFGISIANIVLIIKGSIC